MHASLLRRTALAGLMGCAVLACGAPAAGAQVPPGPCTPQIDLAGCELDPRGVDPAAPNPLVGQRWYTDEVWGLPARSARAFAKRGRHREADMMQTLAARPQFRWVGSWIAKEEGGAAGSIRRFLERVQDEQPGSVPQIALMRRNAKGCGPKYQGGGPAEDARTRDWWDAVARGIGDSRVIIAFEPDSLGTVRCVAKSRRRARIEMLRYGVDVMSKLPNATVYIEAGASDWEPAWLTARKLRMVGVHKVRGFMLNATHYDWTLNNIRYGRDVSRRVGGKHFVINTAMNGRGAVHRYVRVGRQTKRRFVRCPLRRGLGPAPTTSTADPLVDAYLYIARPAVGGGYCKGQGTRAGGWDTKRAFMFVRYATEWLRPPKGTRHGLFGKVKLNQLSGAKEKRHR